jgi:hypothetical protein
MASTIKGLLGTDPQQLLDDLNNLREQEQLIGHERELVERVLEILVETGGPAAEWLTDPARGLLTIGPLRTQVLRVIDTGPADTAWQPREVHEQLVAHGNNKVTLDNVRSTMGRMAAGGELFQPEPPLAAFMRPPSDRLTSDPPSEEPHDDT